MPGKQPPDEPAHEARLRVLVVDDDPGHRRALADAVRALDYDCRVALDGENGWLSLESSPADVVLCAETMPRLGGLELSRRLRDAAGHHCAYFVLISATDDEGAAREGADAYLSKPVSPQHLASRLEVAKQLILENRRLRGENAALKQETERLFLAARVDPLTNIANRRQLDEDLADIGARVDRYGHVYSAAICDIDRFKAYNDHYGHLDGDVVLTKVAAAMSAELREGDSIYRYGGEEFLILLAGQALSSAILATERVRGAVEHLAIPTHPEGVITLSAGVAERQPAPDAGSEGATARANEAWLRRADEALYFAKNEGRNRVADSSMPPKK